MAIEDEERESRHMDWTCRLLGFQAPDNLFTTGRLYRYLAIPARPKALQPLFSARKVVILHEISSRIGKLYGRPANLWPHCSCQSRSHDCFCLWVSIHDERLCHSYGSPNSKDDLNVKLSVVFRVPTSICLMHPMMVLLHGIALEYLKTKIEYLSAL